MQIATPAARPSMYMAILADLFDLARDDDATPAERSEAWRRYRACAAFDRNQTQTTKRSGDRH